MTARLRLYRAAEGLAGSRGRATSSGPQFYRVQFVTGTDCYFLQLNFCNLESSAAGAENLP